VIAEPMAILTFSIGPVHSFIGQARRIADLWAGSQILSDLAREAVEMLLKEEGATLIFPAATLNKIPQGLPNRLVSHVPLARSTDIAERVKSKVCKQWERIVEHGIAQLMRLQIDVDGLKKEHLWEDAIQCSWSWVSEERGYAEASKRAIELHAASRLFRPFAQSDDNAGMKCAICGERNALPGWKDAEAYAKKHVHELARYVRNDQTRLCLVCASKRFYPEFAKPKDRRTIFDSFDKFQPRDDRDERERPYFALVSMDGDHLGEALRDKPEDEQKRISAALGEFAASLKTCGSAELNLRVLGLDQQSEPSDEKRRRPQLIYAGGEDVLFVADPREAIRCARAIREHYGKCFEGQHFERTEHTISAAIIFAHTKIPAGRLLHDAEELLKRKAKTEAGRNAVALALHKRSGPEVETVFPWEGDIDAGLLQKIVDELKSRNLASRQTYHLGDEQRVLTEVFTEKQQWQTWLEWRLTRGEGSRKHVTRLAALLAPLFVDETKRVEALRIARFLAIEVEGRRPKEQAAATGATA
jgi:CRISPR-associated protein Cmr2